MDEISMVKYFHLCPSSIQWNLWHCRAVPLYAVPLCAPICDGESKVLYSFVANEAFSMTKTKALSNAALPWKIFGAKKKV